MLLRLNRILQPRQGHKHPLHIAPTTPNRGTVFANEGIGSPNLPPQATEIRSEPPIQRQQIPITSNSLQRQHDIYREMAQNALQTDKLLNRNAILLQESQHTQQPQPDDLRESPDDQNLYTLFDRSALASARDVVLNDMSHWEMSSVSPAFAIAQPTQLLIQTPQPVAFTQSNNNRMVPYDSVERNSTDIIFRDSFILLRLSFNVFLLNPPPPIFLIISYKFIRYISPERK